ncbi:MAG TPA: bifunctional alpha,alpha-trehalose-phosphate synthase (UDP-forming)/trehalose-phosphatase, partial [Candidatus Brachybacterium merdigallinarum]|nr:bifunctional alpha,alpha-trehalose-phosphate synthase (UDP-forming)/trehalose-phosphatase [Candidatus Brachybacterium merdigallinarum]
EFSVVDANKGSAVQALARANAADSWLYLGDDVTDESVFQQIGEDDLGIKVGGGDTAATHRIADPAAARDLLLDLARRRRDIDLSE